MQRKILTFQKV